MHKPDNVEPADFAVNSRPQLTNAIVSASRQHDAVLALWESGSEAFGRTDDYSDIDLTAVVAPNAVDDVATFLRSALEQVAPIANEYRQNTFHGDSQYFWQFDGVSEFLLVDIDLLEKKSAPPAIDPSTHGNIRVHFDKCDCVLLAEEAPDARRLRVRETVARIDAVQDLQPLLLRKYLLRQNVLHCYGEYQRGLVRPLIELLRIKYCPARSSFQTTYIEWDLPAECVRRLEPLILVRGLDEMEENLPILQNWIRELTVELREL